MVALMIGLLASPVIAGDQLLRELDQCLKTGDLTQAVSLGEKICSDSNLEKDITLPIARLARELQRRGKMDDAATFYMHAIDASERPQADSLPQHAKNMLRIATALLLSEQGQNATACNLLEKVTERLIASGNDDQKPSIENAAKILNQIGSTCLDEKDFKTAERAFSLSTQLHSENQATAELGYAWAVAFRGNDPGTAAKTLESFIQRYPEHPDADQAAMLAIECYQKANDTQATLNAVANFLSKWPESKLARKLVNEFSESQFDQIPRPVQNWILDHASTEQIQQLSPNLLSIALLIATDREMDTSWLLIAQHLGKIDQNGNATDKALTALSSHGDRASAERLAGGMLAPTEPDAVTGAAREAACRWAGLNEKWSMLALASETEVVDTPTPSRTSTVERLFAEALVQLGRIKDALDWWNYLADVRGETDFATLLRCAEAETSSGTDPEKARQRIEAAKSVAGQNLFNLALVNLLEAELAIRKTSFDDARKLLREIAKNELIEKDLRGRAQWLTGETYFLQQQYSNAILAYREVEVIDAAGPWVAASLIQAGKSFEQLGHKREALICYTNLINRFNDSSYASAASKRVAAISPQQSTESKEANPSIKR